MKATLPGVRLTSGPVPAPVPERVALCGLPLPLSTILTIAVRVPLAKGVKVKLMVHRAPAATEFPQVLTSEKSLASAPVSATLVMLKAAFPELVTVMACVSLVFPKARVAKIKPEGARLTLGASANPVPLIATVCGLPEALSEMLSVPRLAPAAVGEKEFRHLSHPVHEFHRYLTYIKNRLSQYFC